MKYLSFLTLAFFMIILASCSEDEPKKKASGYFKLAQMQSPASRTTGRVNATAKTSFDLGIVKASREFYFLLANGGENDITNVELTTDNPAFIISPASISLLPATGSDSEALVPLVSLGVEHGPRLNGVGYTNLLPKGENKVTLIITGSTIENGETILLESTFTLTIDVKVMDLTLYSDNEEVNYANYSGQYTGSEFNSGLFAIPAYWMNPENFKVKNTGNTDIALVVDHWVSPNQAEEITLKPNETVTITFPAPVTGNYYTSLLTLNGNGTITNQARIKQGTDGKGYILVERHNLDENE